MKLDDYLNTVRRRPFDWETWNCCHFVAGWVRAAEGFDPLDEFRGVLLCAGGSRGALRIARAAGGLAGAATRALNRPPCPPALAGVGDLVYFAGNETAGTIAICNGASAILVSDIGLVTRPMDGCQQAWKIYK